MLRKAFSDSMSDPDFLEEAAKMQLDLNPLSGARVSEIVNESLATPPELVEKVRATLAQ
jgi:hypothetical protein